MSESRNTAPARAIDRRAALAMTGGAVLAPGIAQAAARATAPFRRLRGDMGAMPITRIDSFDVMVPQPAGYDGPKFAGAPGRINVTVVETAGGVRGYSFLGTIAAHLAAAQPVLIGADLFQIERHLAHGLMNWGGIEEAMWDAIGRIAGQPVAHLLGGASLPAQPVYVTYVWPGTHGQETITPREQAAQAVVLKDAGFHAMKIQIHRRDYHRDAEACAEILAAGGPGFRVMVDRTANRSPTGLWTYEQALDAAHALERAGCYWLEEPLARDDYDGPARLRRESRMLITGGEGYHGLEPFRQCLLHGTYDILQPELRLIAGIWTARKVGVLADVWGLKTAPHGINGPAWAGRLQLAAAMGSIYQEIAVLNPPWLPDDYFRPFLPLFHGEQPFTYADGACLVPQHPGLGLNVDEKALARFRVEGFQPLSGPQPP